MPLSRNALHLGDERLRPSNLDANSVRHGEILTEASVRCQPPFRQGGLDSYQMATETLGQLIARGRKDAGLTQEELARRVKTSRPTITSIERGYRRYISTSLVIKLAAALEVPPGLLLAELGIKPSDAAQATFQWLAEQLDDPNRRRLTAIGIALLQEQTHQPPTEHPRRARPEPQCA